MCDATHCPNDLRWQHPGGIADCVDTRGSCPSAHAVDDFSSNELLKDRCYGDSACFEKAYWDLRPGKDHPTLIDNPEP